MGQIYERMRFKGKSLPNRKSQVLPTAYTTKSPDPALKGMWNGNCNITSCQKPGATWWNIYRRRYYCARCAFEINYNPNEIVCVPGDGTELKG